MGCTAQLDIGDWINLSIDQTAQLGYAFLEFVGYAIVWVNDESDE
jgi:hypothetical protein